MQPGMAYPTPASARRPGTVTAAAFAMLGAATVGCAYLIWNMLRVFRADSSYGESGSATEKLTAAIVLMVMLMLIFFTVALTLFDLRGRRGAWLTSIVYCYLMTFVAALPVAVLAIVGIQAAISVTVAVVNIAVSALMVIPYLVAGVLFVLPTSRQYYRKPRYPVRFG